MELCNCENDKISCGGFICDPFPLGEGDNCRHTSFSIHLCNKCKKVFGFPGDNLQLALTRGSKKAIDYLEMKVNHLINDIEEENNHKLPDVPIPSPPIPPTQREVFNIWGQLFSLIKKVKKSINQKS